MDAEIRLLMGITQPPRTAFILEDYVRPIAPPGRASEHSAPPYVQAHWGSDNYNSNQCW